MDFDKLKATIQASVGYDSQGHWCTVKPLNTEGLHGFVYVIHNQKDDRYYIGKKNFYTAVRSRINEEVNVYLTTNTVQKQTGKNIAVHLEISKET